MQGIIHDLSELKKRGSGLMVVFVDNGTVSFTATSFSDEYPNDLCLVKTALKSVLELTMHERYAKEMLRKEGEELIKKRSKIYGGKPRKVWRCTHKHTKEEHPGCYAKYLDEKFNRVLQRMDDHGQRFSIKI
jgi:hypothetical protein